MSNLDIEKQNDERQKDGRWISAAIKHGGSFVSTFGKAARNADDENYEILRPALTALMAKYPKYSAMADAE